LVGLLEDTNLCAVHANVWQLLQKTSSYHVESMLKNHQDGKHFIL
jgi:hypothetical protein